jgi:hypothetical protein
MRRRAELHETETLAPAFSSMSLNFAASSFVSPPFTTLGAPAQHVSRLQPQRAQQAGCRGNSWRGTRQG